MADGTKLKEKLFNQKKNGWEGLSEKQRNEIFNYCNGYMGFLNKGKTVFYGTIEEAIENSPCDKFEDAYLWYSDEEGK